jgi:hypothetical protein
MRKYLLHSNNVKGDNYHQYIVLHEVIPIKLKLFLLLEIQLLQSLVNLALWVIPIPFFSIFETVKNKSSDEKLILFTKMQL